MICTSYARQKPDLTPMQILWTRELNILYYILSFLRLPNVLCDTRCTCEAHQWNFTADFPAAVMGTKAQSELMWDSGLMKPWRLAVHFALLLPGFSDHNPFLAQEGFKEKVPLRDVLYSRFLLALQKYYYCCWEVWIGRSLKLEKRFKLISVPVAQITAD